MQPSDILSARSCAGRPGFPSISSIFLIAIFVVMLLGVRTARAQFRASLSGTVADQTGAIVPNAKVTLMDKDTNQTRVSTSNGEGLYTFNALPPDRFSLTAEAQGFKKK